MWRLTVFALAGVALAADPAGFHYWSGAELRGFSKSLAPKLNEQKSAGQPLANLGTHTFSISHREGDGKVEVHEKMNDVFVAETGEATLLVGGEMVGGKQAKPGEWLGDSIKGGVKRRLSPGDIVHIPARMPHQLLIPAGKEFTYFVVKVETK